MKIRSKLSFVVWALVGITLCLSTLFVWGALRGQRYLQRVQLANQHHHSLLLFSRSVDQFFSVVLQSLARPDDVQIEKICDASWNVREVLAVLVENADVEIAFVEGGEGDGEGDGGEDKKARLLSLRDDWDELEQDLVTEVTATQDVFEPRGPEAWQRVLSRTLRFSEQVDESIRNDYRESHAGVARLDKLFGELALTGVVAWLTCSLIVGLTGFLFARRIMTPIHRLSRASRALGDGKLTPVHVRGNDELADLADAFNTMAAQVESQQLVLLCAKGSVEAKNAALETEAAARREALRALEQAKNVAETANRAKSDFLARMSHEIRTPMNGITGMADVLLDAELGDELDECAQTIRASAQALLEIVNHVLDFSKIEAGEMQVERLAFDLKKLTDDVVRLLAPRAKEKHLGVTRRYSPDAPTWFVGDPGRIRQVLINLLGNAIKFTHEGRVEIRVECDGETSGNARVTMTVEDTGVGVQTDHLEKIFEEFGQANVSTTREYGGTGLGLSISKGLVKLMGGEIGVKSSPGVGSSFWFSLSLETAENPTGENEVRPEKHAREAPTYGKRILVVDDNAVNRLVAKRLLERLDCFVVTTNGGQESIELLRKSSFDLVLMDCRMPGMDGFEATAAIRELEAESGRRIPVVAVTANALDGDKERCIQAGMDDYVAKPIGIADLRAVLERWAPGRRGEESIDVECVRTGRVLDEEVV